MARKLSIEYKFIRKFPQSFMSHLNDFLDFFVYESGSVGGALAIQHNDGISENHARRSTTVMSAGQWYHVAVTSDGSIWTLYINGMSESLVSVAGSNNGLWFNDMTGSHANRIANRQRSADNNFFDGLIDDVRIYNRALSATEIKRLYNMGK